MLDNLPPSKWNFKRDIREMIFFFRRHTEERFLMEKYRQDAFSASLLTMKSIYEVHHFSIKDCSK